MQFLVVFVAMPLFSAAMPSTSPLHIESPHLGVFMRARPATTTSDNSAPSSSDSTGPAFSEWSEWSNCSTKCTQRRRRQCLTPGACGRNVIIEKRECPEKKLADGSLIESCQPKRDARHQTFLKRLLSDIYDPAREEESALTMEEFLYSDWTIWSRCSRTCRQKRFKECQFPLLCGRKLILEERGCYPEGTRCSEMKRNNETYNRTKIVFKGDDGDDEDVDEMEEQEGDFLGPDPPVDADVVEGVSTPTKEEPRTEGRRERKREKRVKNETAIAFGDFECGQRPTFNPRRLRIIGGTLSRRGAWPWQVSVMNRFVDSHGYLSSINQFLSIPEAQRHTTITYRSIFNLVPADGARYPAAVRWYIRSGS